MAALYELPADVIVGGQAAGLFTWNAEDSVYDLTPLGCEVIETYCRRHDRK